MSYLYYDPVLVKMKRKGIGRIPVSSSSQALYFFFFFFPTLLFFFPLVRHRDKASFSCLFFPSLEKKKKRKQKEVYVFPIWLFPSFSHPSFQLGHIVTTCSPIIISYLFFPFPHRGRWFQSSPCFLVICPLVHHSFVPLSLSLWWWWWCARARSPAKISCPVRHRSLETWWFAGEVEIFPSSSSYHITPLVG